MLIFNVLPFRSSVAPDVKSNTLLADAEETTMLQPSRTILSALPANEEEEDSLSLSEVEDDNCQENLLQDQVHGEDPKFDSKLQDSIHEEVTKFESSKETDKPTHLHVDSQLCSKDFLLSHLPGPKSHHQKASKDKQTLPQKSKIFSLLLKICI